MKKQRECVLHAWPQRRQKMLSVHHTYRGHGKDTAYRNGVSDAHCIPWPTKNTRLSHSHLGPWRTLPSNLTSPLPSGSPPLTVFLSVPLTCPSEPSGLHTCPLYQVCCILVFPGLTHMDPLQPFASLDSQVFSLTSSAPSMELTIFHHDLLFSIFLFLKPPCLLSIFLQAYGFRRVKNCHCHFWPNTQIQYWTHRNQMYL